MVQTDYGAIFPLALARTGEKVVISAIRAGKGLARKLLEQGIRPGITVTIIQKRGGGFVLGFDRQRIALGAGMTQKLFVSIPSAGNQTENIIRGSGHDLR